MNCFQVRCFARSGAEAMPASFRMLATVLRQLSMPSPTLTASLICTSSQHSSRSLGMRRLPLIARRLRWLSLKSICPLPVRTLRFL